MDATDAEGETALYLDADAAALLAQLEPEPERRGSYVSELIRAAAQGREPGSGATGGGSRSSTARALRRTRGANRAQQAPPPRPPLSEGDQQLADDQRQAGSGG